MKLREFFLKNPETAIAFSGGVDSAYLLYAAMRWGKRVKAYYVKSQFQPEFELQDALELAKDLGVDMEVIRVDVLADPVIASNPIDRCYYCKKMIFNEIKKTATADGFSLLLDGTNASDDAGDRPGMKALTELEVRSPLRECALTKPEIRERSKEAGLFTWEKPAYAFLAGLGFTDFRIRMMGNGARLQVPGAQFAMVLAHRKEITAELKKYYGAVLLDLEERG